MTNDFATNFTCVYVDSPGSNEPEEKAEVCFIKTQRYHMRRQALAVDVSNRLVDPLLPGVFFFSPWMVSSMPQFSEAHSPLSLSLVVLVSQAQYALSWT